MEQTSFEEELPPVSDHVERANVGEEGLEPKMATAKFKSVITAGFVFLVRVLIVLSLWPDSTGTFFGYHYLSKPFALIPQTLFNTFCFNVRVNTNYTRTAVSISCHFGCRGNELDDFNHYCSGTALQRNSNSEG